MSGNGNTVESVGNLRKRRKAAEPRIKWDEQMERDILEYARNRQLEGKDFEKPTAPEFYKKFLEVTPHFPNVGITKLLQHMKNLKRSYTSALEWRKKTGEGILESDPISGVMTVEAAIMKRCKYFEELDELLGDKPQFNPPYQHHTDLPNEALEPGSFNEEKLNDSVEEILRDTSRTMETRESVNEGENITVEGTEDVLVEQTTTKTYNSSRKKARKSPIKSAAAALESSMKSRIEHEEQRLQWEKECEIYNRQEKEKEQKQERELKQRQFDFEREKWTEEITNRKENEQRRFQLEKYKLDQDAALAKYKIDKEYELKLREQRQ